MQIAYFDVDETLIKDEPAEWQREGIEMNYYGMPRIRWPHKRHVELVISHKARGFHIIVWSANGKLWAEEAVKRLGLEEYVDSCQDKPTVMFDDKQVSDWCPVVWVEDK